MSALVSVDDDVEVLIGGVAVSTFRWFAVGDRAAHTGCIVVVREDSDCYAHNRWPEEKV